MLDISIILNVSEKKYNAVSAEAGLFQTEMSKISLVIQLRFT